MNDFHKPVLLKEVIEFLEVKEGERYIDATIGGGGHTFEIQKSGGKILGIDLDEEAIDYVKKILRDKDIKILGEKYDESLNISISQYPNITLVHGNFKDIDTIAHLNDFESVAGIIFDLGVSSHQLESPERGFSFQKEGPLDMRMDQSGEEGQIKAVDLINALTKGELYELFTKLGEERFARAICSNIVRTRGIKKIETTGELAEIIRKSYPKGFRMIDPATLVFQALRIAINDELNNLREALPKAVNLLKNRGKLLVISFHSLEDRIVKNEFKRFEQEDLGQVVTKKPISPSDKELELNRRARSAKLRVFERK